MGWREGWDVIRGTFDSSYVPPRYRQPVPQGPSPEAIEARRRMQEDLRRSAESYDRVIRGADGVIQVYKDAGNWVERQAEGFGELYDGRHSDAAVREAQANSREVEALMSDKKVTYTHVSGNEYRKLEGETKTPAERQADDRKLVQLMKDQIKGRLETLDKRLKEAEAKGDEAMVASIQTQMQSLETMSRIELRPGQTLDEKVRDEKGNEITLREQIGKMTKNLGHLKAHNRIGEVTGKAVSAAGTLEDGLILGAQIVANVAAPGVGGLIIGEAMATADKGGVWTPRLDGKQHKGAIAAVLTGQPVKWDDILETGLNAIPVPGGGSAGKEAGKAVAKEALKAAEKEVVKAIERTLEKEVIRQLERTLGRGMTQKVGQVLEHRIAQFIGRNIRGKTFEEIKRFIKEELPKAMTELTGYNSLSAIVQDIGAGAIPPMAKEVIKSALEGAGLMPGGRVDGSLQAATNWAQEQYNRFMPQPARDALTRLSGARSVGDLNARLAELGDQYGIRPAFMRELPTPAQLEAIATNLAEEGQRRLTEATQYVDRAIVQPAVSWTAQQVATYGPKVQAAVADFSQATSLDDLNSRMARFADANGIPRGAFRQMPTPAQIEAVTRVMISDAGAKLQQAQEYVDRTIVQPAVNWTAEQVVRYEPVVRAAVADFSQATSLDDLNSRMARFADANGIPRGAFRQMPTPAEIETFTKEMITQAQQRGAQVVEYVDRTIVQPAVNWTAEQVVKYEPVVREAVADFSQATSLDDLNRRMAAFADKYGIERGVLKNMPTPAELEQMTKNMVDDAQRLGAQAVQYLDRTVLQPAVQWTQEQYAKFAPVVRDAVADFSQATSLDDLNSRMARFADQLGIDRGVLKSMPTPAEIELMTKNMLEQAKQKGSQIVQNIMNGAQNVYNDITTIIREERRGRQLDGQLDQIWDRRLQQATQQLDAIRQGGISPEEKRAATEQAFMIREALTYKMNKASGAEKEALRQRIADNNRFMQDNGLDPRSLAEPAPAQPGAPTPPVATQPPVQPGTQPPAQPGTEAAVQEQRAARLRAIGEAAMMNPSDPAALDAAIMELGSDADTSVAMVRATLEGLKNNTLTVQQAQAQLATLPAVSDAAMDNARLQMQEKMAGNANLSLETRMIATQRELDVLENAGTGQSLSQIEAITAQRQQLEREAVQKVADYQAGRGSVADGIAGAKALDKAMEQKLNNLQKRMDLALNNGNEAEQAQLLEEQRQAVEARTRNTALVREMEEEQRRNGPAARRPAQQGRGQGNDTVNALLEIIGKVLGIDLSGIMNRGGQDQTQSTQQPPAAPQPTTTPPVATQPTTTPPAAPQPTTTPPAATQPTTTPPVATQPTTTPPAATQPTTTPPAATQPTTTPPAATQPTTTPPVATQPTTTPPVATQPTTPPPAATQPTTTPPAATQPTTTTPQVDPERVAEARRALDEVRRSVETKFRRDNNLPATGDLTPEQRTAVQNAQKAAVKDVSTRVVGGASVRDASAAVIRNNGQQPTVQGPAAQQPPAAPQPSTPQPPVAPQPSTPQPPVAPQPSTPQPPAAQQPPVAPQPSTPQPPAAQQPPAAPQPSTPQPPAAQQPPAAPQPSTPQPPAAPQPPVAPQPSTPQPPAAPLTAGPNPDDIIIRNTRNAFLAGLADTNNDGKITRAELEAARQRLDRDGDGTASRAEVAAAVASNRRGDMARINEAAEIISAAGAQITDDKTIVTVVNQGQVNPTATRAAVMLDQLAGSMPDGNLTRAELDAARARADRNGDGVVTSAEVAAALGTSRTTAATRLAAQVINEDATRQTTEKKMAFTAAANNLMDENKDGRITKEEATKALAAMDKDGDGTVTKAEMAEALAARSGVMAQNSPADLLKDKGMAAALAQLGGALRSAGVAVDGSGAVAVGGAAASTPQVQNGPSNTGGRA